ncbi:hypothetical protein SAMN04488568_11455 [Maricaulis salignorans]|uniref:Uncharacterized protein n=1 Tax=Maricaulis salignorans TaxID=144026 RepID=A0A1G9UA52_9PROT|nr:hypothetical protein SAMN04488568_11455 [Maricaulis salignorans]
MLKLVETPEAKASAQALLEKRLYESLDDQGVLNIGFPGGNYNIPVYAAGPDRLWAGFKEPANDYKIRRYWNAFGVFDRDLKSQAITVEINIAADSNSKQVAGAFATDLETGDTILLHSGKIGGGHKGVGRTAFLVWSKAELVEVVDIAGGIREGIIIAGLNSPNLADEVWDFVRLVSEFKLAVRAGELETEKFRNSVAEYERYSKEFSGKKSGGGGARGQYFAMHGRVVQALFDERSRQATSEEKVLNSGLIDLYVRRSGRITEVYEVKAKSDRQSIYSAIGQLVTHSCTEGADARKFLVIPEEWSPSSGFEAAFTRYEIEIIGFGVDKEREVTFRRPSNG